METTPPDDDPGPDGLGPPPPDPPISDERDDQTGGIPVFLGKESTRWPDPEIGPYLVETWWAQLDGHLECVGLRLSSIREVVEGDDIYYLPAVDRFEPVAAGDLRKAPWKRLMDGYRESWRAGVVEIGLSEEQWRRASERLRERGLDPESASQGDWLAVIPEHEQRQALGFQPTLPEPRPRPPGRRGGRKPVHTHDDWLERAAIYDDAARRGLSPNKELAKRFEVHLTRAQSWTAQMRRKGYLPPAPGPGRPGP